MHKHTTHRRPCRLAASLAVAAVCTAFAPAFARADTVTDWNETASTAIVGTAGQPPPVSVLSFAMVQGAVYDAVNAIDRGHRAYLHRPPARRSDSKDAAAATAAYLVLVGLFPLQQSTLQPLYDASLAGVPNTPPGAKAGGIAAGEAAAAAMLAARANDGRFPDLPFTPCSGRRRGSIGRRRRLRAGPGSWVGNVRPFVVPNVEILRTQPPNALTSRAYARDFNEVKTAGSLHSTTRTPDAPLPRSSGRTMPSRSGTAPSARSPRAGIWTSPTTRGCSRPRTWPPRTPRSAAGTTSTTGTRGAPSPRSAKPPATGTGPRRPTRTGHRCSIRPRRPRRPRSSRRRSPSTPRATTARPARSCGRSGTSSTPTRSRSARPATRRGPRGPIAASPTRSRRTSTPGSGLGIDFRTADVQGARLGKKVARYLHKHYLQPVD